ncbi:MAG: carboxypeptidase-like regulatory domain-containing protein [Kofleriaceae bacterium]
MSLHPCPSCRRHVAEIERVCPFCGAAVGAIASPTSPSKLTRAAIFASTALAAPACWSSKAAPTDTTHEHGSADRTQVTPVPDPDAGLGTIVVTVVDGNHAPVPGRQVRLVGAEIPEIATDARGVATFPNVPPGSYQVESHDGHPRHSPTVITVAVKAGEVAASTLTVYIAPYNPNQTPMPYGAPPSRRRVV